MGNADPAAGPAFVQKNIDKFDAITAHGLLQEFKKGADSDGDNANVSGLLGQKAPGAVPGVADAIHAQEASSATSVSAKGARGEWQIIPGTFKQYAQAGERIDNPADNELVGRRIIDDLAQKFGNDPARIAVGYVSGPDNVSPPGSATPWIEDEGGHVSAYANGVLGRLNGGSSSTTALAHRPRHRCPASIPI
jgi:Transglycosylase SLT domain